MAKQRNGTVYTEYVIPVSHWHDIRHFLSMSKKLISPYICILVSYGGGLTAPVKT
jgi:hypothetical protein